MTEKRRKQRQAPISYRPPSDRRSELYALQLQSGLAMNAFITDSIFGSGTDRRKKLQDRDVARLLSYAARLREHLDILAAAHPEQGPEAGALRDAERELDLLRTALIAATGRAP